MADREKLIGLIEQFCRGLSINDIQPPYGFENLADYLISNGVTMQEWFPASEPPKERGRYLCYFKYEPESPDVVCENTYYGSGHWMSEKDRVTHWAYLPNLPEGN